MDAVSLRRAFLEFFARRDHTVVSSAALVPNDATLLFTNAGMVQFKDAFLGLERRPYTRAASSQKCLRVTGKHNDLETVGPSPRHHTFFEMLGNFSFGDYFKKDAILYAYEFMTTVAGLSPDDLIFTVHESDDEAWEHWVHGIGVPSERVLRMGDATNFWMMADIGPCGPTSEIHYDYGPEACTCRRADCSVALDNGCDRWLEVWNLVFMQFDQAADGTRVALPQTGVDTGMGLERLAAVVQGRRSTYETDLFQPIMDRVQEALGHDDAQRDSNLVGYRVLADHGRAMTFLIADGVLPGNDGRNYVLRLIMRRAMRFGRQIGFREPFLAELAGAAVDTMSASYPELAQKYSWIQEVVVEEEARFARTLESGLELLDGVIAGVRSSGAGQIAGADVFRLYDTFGFPPDLTRQVAEEHGLSIDRPGFEAAMQAQRERARAEGRFASEELGQVVRRLELPHVVFTGYSELDSDAHVVALVMNGESVASAKMGADVFVILDTTPFYAEAGGQVGDTGTLSGSHGAARVLDTQRPIAGIIAHAARVEAGELRVGDPIRASVDGERRGDIMRNHTATHLLHAALQAVLGGHAQQRGSLVAPDRLRFDFAHLKALSQDELADIESRVQAWVREDARVTTAVMPLDEARHAGATMLFGEKYGDDVRVLTVEGTSMELCGGTHVSATGQIGTFVIQSEGSVGSGLRRIEALTGRGADAFVRERLELLGRVGVTLGTNDALAIPERIADLEARSKELERSVERLELRLAAQEAAGLVPLVKTVGGVPAVAVRVDAISAEALRSRADAAREELGSALIVLGAVVDGAPRFVAAVTDDLAKNGWHAGELVKAMAELVGGRGGGRPHLAEAGGGDPEALDGALGQFENVVLQLAARDAVHS